MASRQFSTVIDNWLKEVCLHINSSILLMDDASAEVVHWHGGLPRLLDSGALAVRNLSIFEKVHSSYKKGVFLISSPLSAEILRTIMVIVRNSGFNYCIVICSLPAQCHEIDVPDSTQIFSYLEKQLMSWMGYKAQSANVLHIPVFAACLLSGIFFIPTLSKFFFPVSSDFEMKNSVKYALEGGMRGIPDVMKHSFKVLAYFLNAMLEGMHLKGEIFSVGKLSHKVGVELENIIHTSKKKVISSKASVVLIDRSLDLAGPLSQTTDTPYGKMLRTLFHLPGHVCDINVNMENLCNCKNEKVFDFPLLAPGCIAHKNNSIEEEVLKILLTSKFKEAVMDINRKIVQLNATEGLPIEPGGNMNALKLLKKGISALGEKPDLLLKYCGLLQQATSIVQTLEHSDSAYIDNLLATEKLLIQNYSLSKQGIAEDLSRLITSRKERNYKMADILSLVAFLYALSDVGVLDSESEASIQASIIEALFQEDTNTQNVTQSIAGYDADDQDILNAVKAFFSVLKQFGDARKDLKVYRNILEPGDAAMPAIYKPILKQVMDNIFNSNEISDLEFHSAGLRDYIKTGFSLFMNVAKPLPNDNPVIIVFVIGGVTASELKMMNEIISRQKTTKILFGSTSILTPECVIQDLFKTVRKASLMKEVSEDF